MEGSMTSTHAYDLRSVGVTIFLFSLLLCWASFPSAGESQSAVSTKEKVQAQPVDVPVAVEGETLKRVDTSLPAGDRQSVPDHNGCRYAESFDRG